MRVQRKPLNVTGLIPPAVLLLALASSIGVQDAGPSPSPFWKLPVLAGLNLVSLPSYPASWDINELFGATTEIDLIIAYEGLQPKVAVRDPDTGRFVGSLSDHNLAYAYWIRASEEATVAIYIPSVSHLSHIPSLPPPKERRPAGT